LACAKKVCLPLLNVSENRSWLEDDKNGVHGGLKSRKLILGQKTPHPLSLTLAPLTESETMPKLLDVSELARSKPYKAVVVFEVAAKVLAKMA
jgi:hypothetical protein